MKMSNHDLTIKKLFMECEGYLKDVARVDYVQSRMDDAALEGHLTMNIKLDCKRPLRSQLDELMIEYDK